MASSGGKLELKLLIEKKSRKILFAEVGKDVVDFLFRLLSLPIGSVTELITEESALSPLCNAYRSWEQLNDSFLSSCLMTANHLIPAISPTSSSNFTRLLSSANPATMKEKVYVCNCKDKFDDVHQTFCPRCRNLYSYYPLSYSGYNVTKEKVERDGYVKGGFTYAVMDDLSIVPMTPLVSIALLNKMGHQDLSLLEEKTVSLDVEQGWELLKTSLRSKNVLADVFLPKKKDDDEAETKLDDDIDNFELNME